MKFPIDPTTQLPKAHCYVDFIHQNALEQALAKNGSVFRDNKLVINRPNTQFSEGARGRNGSLRGRSNYRNSRIQ